VVIIIMGRHTGLPLRLLYNKVPHISMLYERNDPGIVPWIITGFWNHIIENRWRMCCTVGREIV